MAPAERQRWILHVDMDAFYASVESHDDPTLAGRPLIVGGTGKRGVVASCSYEARVFGVRSAMPTARARQLCPQAVFVPGRHGRYAEVSRQIHAVFQRFTPLVEGISLDEAFLDVTGSTRLFGPPGKIAEAIREQIGSELGLSCSVGGASVKFLAKLASEAAKPRVGPVGRSDGAGVWIVPPGEELAFLHPHPIEALWGVGPATAERLRRLGLVTIGDLARVPPAVVEGAIGRAAGGHLTRLARGVDDRGVEPEREVKSISHEETYPTDRRDADGLHVEVVRMADAVASRLRNAGLAGRTVTLKLRYGDFTTITRSVTAPAALDTGPGIAEVAAGALARIDLAPGVRLLGVGVSNLGPAGAGPVEQLSLELGEQPSATSTRREARPAGGPATGPATGPAAGRPPADQRRSGRGRPAAATTEAVDAIRRRFGAGAVGPATLLDARGLRVKQPGDTQWGPSADTGSSGQGPGPAAH